MTDAKLLAIIEVPSEDRVRCQSAGCNHPVFRRIHVVRENSTVRVYGSECFKKLFVGLPVASSMPQYTSADGRHLTEEERQLLIENTERLIQRFESEHQAELARKAALDAARPVPAQTKPFLPLPPPAVANSAVRRVSEAQAKQIVRAKYNVDPDLPGWHGLVLAEMERINHVG
jgi:hypothetical protein